MNSTAAAPLSKDTDMSTATITRTPAGASMFRVDHSAHDLRMMYRTDGSNSRYLFCRTCNRMHDLP